VRPVGADVDGAGRDVAARQHAFEDGPGQRRLVGGDVVAGLEDTSEGVAAALAGEARGGAAIGRGDVGVARGGEGGLVGVGDGEGEGFATEPCGGWSVYSLVQGGFPGKERGRGNGGPTV